VTEKVTGSGAEGKAIPSTREYFIQQFGPAHETAMGAREGFVSEKSELK